MGNWFSLHSKATCLMTKLFWGLSYPYFTSFLEGFGLNLITSLLLLFVKHFLSLLTEWWADVCSEFWRWNAICMGYLVIREMLIFSASFSYLKIKCWFFCCCLCISSVLFTDFLKCRNTYINPLFSRRGYIQVCIGSMWTCLDPVMLWITSWLLCFPISWVIGVFSVTWG